MTKHGWMMALVMLGACADPSAASKDGPEWWRFAADVGSPVGGVWQSKGGACLYAWHDRIQWDGEVVECSMMDHGNGYACLTGLDGWLLEPTDDAAGYLGEVVLTFPEGRTATLEPDCR